MKYKKIGVFLLSFVLPLYVSAAGEIKEAETVLEQILDEDPDEPAASAKLEEIRSGRTPDVRRPVSRSSSR